MTRIEYCQHRRKLTSSSCKKRSASIKSLFLWLFRLCRSIQRMGCLNELGLLPLKSNKVDDSVTSKRIWCKFFGCLSDYRDDSGNTFNTLNIIMAFVLLGTMSDKEKIDLLYENLDWQCRGYVQRSMIKLFIENFCVVGGEMVPYYAEDTYNSMPGLKDFRELWCWAVKQAPEHILKKVASDWPRLNKQEFVLTLSSEKYRFLFNAVLLRRWLIKKYKEEFVKHKELQTGKSRISEVQFNTTDKDLV
eukprot:TRINITY_DN2328_c0_g1_i4.p1 TRINITY_DN2328_c0_g1~~TRINITY_DN2328_c0_g1_i4.p1  ORF type:complete len:247 (+),score=40.80 TRINITY_DN2328_c0_g1_i4:157-897(+)